MCYHPKQKLTKIYDIKVQTLLYYHDEEYHYS